MSRARDVTRRHPRPVIALAVVTVAAALATPVSTAGVAPHRTDSSGVFTWAPVSPMSAARAGQTATLLPDGDVLVAGGGTATAELYHPSTGDFTATGTMSVSRTDATATLLQDGLVLVAGGRVGGRQLASAELYDPVAGTWTGTGAMQTARSGQTATLLPDGDVLVAGGGCNGHGYGCDSSSLERALGSAEIYDPSTGEWTKTAPMSHRREYFTSTLLPSGQVLVAGGFSSCDDDLCRNTATAELYDPSSGTWSRTGSMLAARQHHTATLLPNGSVLVTGGAHAGYDDVGIAEAELYDPDTGQWTRTASMLRPHAGQTASLLPNGWVMVAGGGSASAEIYQPDKGIWVAPGSMTTVRSDHTATLLGDGDVLVTGGDGPDGRPQPTAEVFRYGRGPLVELRPSRLNFEGQQVGSTSPAERFAVVNQGSAPLHVSGVAVSGAHPADFRTSGTCARATVAPDAECSVHVRFAPSATGPRTARVGLVDDAPRSPQREAVSGVGAGPNVWVPTGSLATPRDEDAAVRLRDGTVLVIGGQDGPLKELSSAELYDPVRHTFAPTEPMNAARSYPAATLLGNGEVLVAGGYGQDGPLASAELYDPATHIWAPTTPMHAPGYALTSTLLPSGNVLVTGIGFESAEVYDPTTATWHDTGPMIGRSVFAAATLLDNGEVLLAGGGSTRTSLYDPATDTWTATGSLHTARQRPTATLLPDGEVLVAGGSAPDGGPALSSSELYDPATGTWSLTRGPMVAARYGAVATLLTSGQVLVAGGCTGSCNRTDVTSSAEAYDPASGYWHLLAAMNQSRCCTAGALLRDGSFLVAGGSNYCCTSYAKAEVYHPTVLFANPSSGPPGQHVRLRANGFYAFEQVRVVFAGQRVARLDTTKRGTFATRIRVPNVPPGDYPVTATGATSFAQATVNFEVTGSRRG